MNIINYFENIEYSSNYRTVTGKINGTYCKFKYDTGAAVNVVPKQMIKLLKLEYLVDRRYRGRPMRGIGMAMTEGLLPHGYFLEYV